MNLKALVTMLVLGSSSLALADHDRGEPAYTQPATPAYTQPATPAYTQPAAPAWRQPAQGWQQPAQGWHQFGGWAQSRPVVLSNDDVAYIDAAESARGCAFTRSSS